MDNESVFGNDFNHHSTAALTQQDRAVLGNVESALANVGVSGAPAPSAPGQPGHCRSHCHPPSHRV